MKTYPVMYKSYVGIMINLYVRIPIKQTNYFMETTVRVFIFVVHSSAVKFDHCWESKRGKESAPREIVLPGPP